MNNRLPFSILFENQNIDFFFDSHSESSNPEHVTELASKVLNLLDKELKKTNSKIGILLSIFFTQTVIKLKNREASNRKNLLYFEFIFNKLGDSDIYF